MCPPSWNLTALESFPNAPQAVAIELVPQERGNGSPDYIALGRTPYPIVEQGKALHTSARIFGKNWTREQLQVQGQQVMPGTSELTADLIFSAAPTKAGAPASYGAVRYSHTATQRPKAYFTVESLV